MKNTLLKITNVILLILLLNQMLTGIRLYGFSHFHLLHKEAAWLLLAFAVIHLILNFSWIKASYFKKKKSHQAQS